jgi:hypothetical protein
MTRHKAALVCQVETLLHPANRPPFQVIGFDPEPEPAGAEEEEEQPSAQEPSKQVPAQVT